jgi:decaprenyl-phosphate phosphoribosyltransferase
VYQVDALPAGPASARAGPLREAGRTGRDLLALLRPVQWSKNVLVVPLALLSAPRWTPAMLQRLCWAIVVFSIAASLVYVVNDIGDRHRDRAHPEKLCRPIAAGRVGVRLAYGYVVVLAAVLAGAVLAGPRLALWPVGLYLVLNVAYSTGVRSIPLVDVFVVASGFVLRVVQGYLAIGYLAIGGPVSPWLLICILSVCLLFCLGKRRHELIVAGTKQRPSLRGYTVAFADQLIVLSAGLTVTAYLLFLNQGVASGNAMLVTFPCALFALFRYLQVLVVDSGGGDPARALLHDRALMVTAALWVALLVGVRLTMAVGT